MANEKLSYEIAALYTGQPAIKAAFDDFAKLNASGARVVNQLQNMARQSQNTGAAIRDTRTAFSQVGMQINQFGTQLAGGTSIATAFAQQIGDVGWALSNASGRLGAVGNFLAGPWGAALALGAAAMAPFIQKLWDIVSGANQASVALDGVIERYKKKQAQEREGIDAQNDLDKLLRKRADLEAYIALHGVKNAAGQLQFVYKQQQELADVNEKIILGRQALDDQRNSTFSLTKAMEGLNKKTEKVRTGLRGGRRSSGSATSDIAKEAKEQQDLAQQLRDIITLRTADNDEVGRAILQLQEFDSLLQKISKSETGKALLTELADPIKQVRDQMVEATQATEYMMAVIPEENPALLEALKQQKDAYEAVGQSVDSAFKNMLTAGGSWRDGMKGIIQSVIDQLWKLYVTQQIVGFVTKIVSGVVGGGNAPTNLLEGTPYMGARAMGGSVMSNKPYLVGEKGPELFVPGASGAIIPNNKTMGAASGGGVVVNVDARGATDPAAIRAQVQQGILEAAPAIIAAAEQRTVSGLRRPRLGGAIQ